MGNMTILFGMIAILTLIPSVCAEAIIIDHNCTDLSQIPDEWIENAKNDLYIVYQHTSHGSQLITGMNALESFPSFGSKYEWSDGGAAGALDLDDFGIPGCADLSQGDWIDENGVTPWVTATRNLLDDPANSHVNVVMWSWCSINGHDITRYLDNMEILVAEYPDVSFVFMTGHAEGQGEGGFIHTANEQIREHCLDNGRILFDFADIENYDPDGNYYYDKPMWDNLDYNPGRTNNWGAEWCDDNDGSELEQLTTGDGVDEYYGCGHCAHSGSARDRNTINCVLKGRATWWMLASLAGWNGEQEIYDGMIYVNTSGWWIDPAQYNSSSTPIQSAINSAGDGSLIYVYDGTYIENVDVNRSLTLQGEGADVVTVTAASADDHVFDVSTGYVNISGFTMTGATYQSGIHLYHADHCDISDNNASDNGYGIYLDHSSSNNTLLNNTANSNSWHGICLYYSSSNMLASNIMSGNSHNFGVYGWSLSHYTQNIDTSNMVDGKPIYYWVDQQDKQIPDDAGFVGVVNSTNITVRDVTLTNNAQGVLFAYTDNSRIEDVNASDNRNGIYLYSSSNNTLADNTASKNYDYGIYLLSFSSNNTLLNNSVSNNQYGSGICLYHSDNNTIYHNNLIDNTQNARDTGTNQWDAGSGGNYYSDYNGTDNNGDGIGDTPYPIPDGTSVDRFPLMQPWGESPPQKGDLNRDGKITTADAVIALQIAAGSRPCDAAMLAAADVSGDGCVTSLDALMILQAAAGAIEL